MPNEQNPTADVRNLQRIEVDDEEQLLAWSHMLGVAPETLKAAVHAVGTDPDPVRAHLAQQQGAGYDR